MTTSQAHVARIPQPCLAAGLWLDGDLWPAQTTRCFSAISPPWPPAADRVLAGAAHQQDRVNIRSVPFHPEWVELRIAGNW